MLMLNCKLYITLKTWEFFLKLWKYLCLEGMSPRRSTFTPIYLWFSKLQLSARSIPPSHRPPPPPVITLFYTSIIGQDNLLIWHKCHGNTYAEKARNCVSLHKMTVCLASLIWLGGGTAKPQRTLTGRAEKLRASLSGSNCSPQLSRSLLSMGNLQAATKLEGGFDRRADSGAPRWRHVNTFFLCFFFFFFLLW